MGGGGPAESHLEPEVVARNDLRNLFGEDGGMLAVGRFAVRALAIWSHLKPEVSARSDLRNLCGEDGGTLAVGRWTRYGPLQTGAISSQKNRLFLWLCLCLCCVCVRVCVVFVFVFWFCLASARPTPGEEAGPDEELFGGAETPGPALHHARPELP